MTDYLTWCEQTRELSLDLKGPFLKSANKISVVVTDKGKKLLLKVIRDETKYVPRLKILGEVAYNLLDYHLNPAERVTPNVCPVSPNTLWRQFIEGIPGEKWRSDLYSEKGSLAGADLVIVDRILESRYAQRIALLDFIFLCQDRSARNWLENNDRFWAIDNGMFWPYKNRYVDKETVKTGNVSHLRPPMEAIISYDYKFFFKIGIFSSLFAGHMINDGLLMWLNQIDWERYFEDLGEVVCYPLDYPWKLLKDWRFENIKQRANWLLDKRRFPIPNENDWLNTISLPKRAKRIWTRKWETKYSEKK